VGRALKLKAQKVPALTKASGEPRRRATSVGSNDTEVVAPQISLETRTREVALEEFIDGTRRRFEARFAGISYASAQFDFRSPSKKVDSKGNRLTWQELHKTKVQLSKPDLVEAALSPMHSSFARAARAALADRVLQNKAKITEQLESGLRLFLYLAPPARKDGELAERVLRQECPTLHDFTAHHLQHIERCVLTACLTPQIVRALERDKLSLDHLIVPGVEMRGLYAHFSRICLSALCGALATLQKAKVIGPMNVRVDNEVSDLLKSIEKYQADAFRERKTAELEPGIAALSEAITAMADDDSRLSIIQKAVLCVMGLEMCSPSRINEVMTMSVHDRLRSVDAYDEEPGSSQGEEAGSMTVTESKLLHRAHAEIKEASAASALDTLPNTVLMKGSKGAAWGAKPLLDFMLVMFNECFDRLEQMGSRSRMLLQHYEKHPKKLYLPPELEHLRGKPLSALDIGRIMLLDGDLGSDPPTIRAKAKAAREVAQKVREVLVKAGLSFTVDQRPDLSNQVAGNSARLIHGKAVGTTSRSAGKANEGKAKQFAEPNARTEYAEWSAVEAELLRRVNKSIDSIRWVTENIQYKGRLSNRLMLFDYLGRSLPYLLGALSAYHVATRLSSTSAGEGEKRIQTVFEALGLTMPIVTDGGAKVEIVPAYCRTHDSRRWLTTMALRHAGPQLSRLLINLWANRADVGQLSRYDYGEPGEKAERTALEVPPAMRGLVSEHEDLSQALSAELSDAYSLKTQTIGIGPHAMRVTTMEDIHAAEQNHPVAKAGGKLILVFPTLFGACLHQHYEVGCTNYRGCGGACSDQRVVKGHLPTNEQVRKRSKELDDVIVAQVRRLILSRNRGVVHDLDRLDEHITRMIQQHMDAEEIAQRLIAEFHQIKDLIKDAAFKADLEDAFAFKGTVEKLDDPECPSGALIRYYNPERHGRPEAERSLEALGGRQTIEAEVKTFLEERDGMRLDNRAANDADDDTDTEGNDVPENGDDALDESSD
jgi:hypothetical protein